MLLPTQFLKAAAALIFFSSTLLGKTPALLDEALQKWGEGKNDWAFTQRVRMLDDDGKTTKEERVERYDPSMPDSQRWHLIEFNGRPPTAAQREQWQDRKNRKPRKHANKPLGDIFDFEQAKLVSETPQEATFAVALRPEAARLVQLDKFMVEVTINKQHKMFERVTVGLREPARVALGLAKILDVDLDVSFDPPARSTPANPAEVQASGKARVVMTKLGDRAEYAWSDFKRVTSNDSAAPAAKSGAPKTTAGEEKAEPVGRDS